MLSFLVNAGLWPAPACERVARCLSCLAMLHRIWLRIVPESLNKNPDFLLRMYRARATIAWGYQHSFAPATPRSPFPRPVWERKGGRVKGGGRQACSAAPALKPLLPVSIASKSCMRCSPTFPEPFWRCHWSSLSKSPGS